MQIRIWIISCLLAAGAVQAQPVMVNNTVPVLPGAMQTEEYLPLLKNKTVAVFANQTSMAGDMHLVDKLLKNGIRVKKIFSPEHGFRGDADAGEKVASSKDKATGLLIISLYGDHNKPTASELKDVEVLLFDIQDVGVRFYTYINSLQHYLEAAVENDKPLLILDRPNPNGFYVDGPVLKPGFTSGVGLQPVPVVYGMTIGEYAKMLLGEKMLQGKAAELMNTASFMNPATETSIVNPLPAHFVLQVIPCKNYDHTMTYDLPVRPSPNLPNLQSVLLYPSVCYFEGTEVSLGRGTQSPFQVFGHPSFADTLYRFTPASLPGAKNPPLLGKTCYGYNLSQPPIDVTQKQNQQIQLSYLMKAYELFPQKDSFFLRPKKGNPAAGDYFFNKLTGNAQLMWQIMNYKPEAEIRQSWVADIVALKKSGKNICCTRILNKPAAF